MSTPATAHVARVHGLADLAAVLPYLLGFTPHESLACLGVADGRVGLVARLDLADVCHPLHGADALDSVFGAVAGTGAGAALAVAVTEGDVDPALADRLVEAAERWELRLLDVALQTAGRCRSLLCADPGCCPPEGVEVDPACGAAAAATYAGSVVLPDRAAVEAEFELPDADRRLVAEPAIAAWENQAVQEIIAGHGSAHTAIATEWVMAAAAAADAQVCDGAAVAPLSLSTAARLAVALSDIAVRDAVWLAVDARQVHGQGPWLELARVVPPPYDAGPLFLLGWRSWRHGDGLRARLAVEATLRADPGYTAARLLEQALDARIDPHRLPRLADDLGSGG